DEHVCAGHFLASRRLHMHRGTLHDALEPRGGQGLAGILGDDALEPVVDERLEIVAQAVDVDAAGLQDRDRVVILGHGEQQVLEGGVFVAALAGQTERAMEGLLEVLGQHGHRATSTSKTTNRPYSSGYSFSNV